jgi:hypothetical protein
MSPRDGRAPTEGEGGIAPALAACLRPLEGLPSNCYLYIALIAPQLEFSMALYSLPPIFTHLMYQPS